MHLPRKWIINNTDLISSRLILLLFDLKTTNPNSKPYTIIDHEINHKAVFRTNQMALLAFGVVFMIVALAIGTKRLALGITIFAFVLIVLDYVGSFSCSSRFLLILRSCFPHLVTCLRNERHDLKQRHSQDYANLSSNNLCEISDDSSGSSECAALSSHCDDFVENIMDEKKIACGGQEFIDGEESESLGNEKRRSRRAILKAKIIRRLLPKRFRYSKYCKWSEGKFMDHSSTSVEIIEVERSVGCLTIRQVISEMESDTEECEYLHFPSEPVKHIGDLIWPSDDSLKNKADRVIFKSSHTSELLKRNGILSKLVTSNTQFYARGKSGYMMLIVIVLAGLICGRILSLFLAIGYCCILKYISTVNKSFTNTIFTSSTQSR